MLHNFVIKHQGFLEEVDSMLLFEACVRTTGIRFQQKGLTELKQVDCK